MKKGAKRKAAPATKKAARPKKAAGKKKDKAAAAKSAASKTPSAPVKKRVVITGGSGFIGHALSHELASKGYHVIILTQSESKQTGHDNETTVHWDGIDTGTLLPYVEGAYAIVNLAGENIFGRWTKIKKKKILESRLGIGKALMLVLQQVEKPPTVLIQASAVGYYGSSEDMLDETSPAGVGFLAEVASQWEASTDAAELLRIRHVTTRFGLVFGTEGGAFNKMVRPFRYCIGGPIGSGNQYVSFIHITDCVRALEFLLENNDTLGVYNLVAPHPCTNRELSTSISKNVHRPMLFGASAFTMKLLFGQFATETVLANQRVIPKRLEQSGFHFLFPTVEQTVTDLLQTKRVTPQEAKNEEKKLETA